MGVRGSFRVRRFGGDVPVSRTRVVTLRRNYVIEIGATMDHLSIQALADAVAAIERIATNNKELLKDYYHTRAEDVMAVCQLAKKAWYDLHNRKETDDG